MTTELHVFRPDHQMFCADCGIGELSGNHGMIPGDGGASGTDFSPQYENDGIRQMYDEQLDLTDYEDDRPDWKFRESPLAEERQRQAEKWGEVVRFAQRCAQGRSLMVDDRLERAADLLERAADLLAEIGVIHSTPGAKRDWIEGRE